MSKLDRSKSFGTVCGESDVKYKYEQDGKFFDHDGNEVRLGVKPPQLAPKIEAKAASASSDESSTQVDRQLKDA